MTKSDVGTRLAELVRHEQAAVRRVEASSVGLSRATAARDAKLRDLEVAVVAANVAYTEALRGLVTTSGMERAAAILDMKPSALRKLLDPPAAAPARKQPARQSPPPPAPETSGWGE